MLLRASADLTFFNHEPTPMVLMLRPRSGQRQWVSAESYEAVPVTAAQEYVDMYGNLCQRLTASQGEFRISASATVEVAETLEREPGLESTCFEELPDAMFHYLVPSRYCESDKMGDLAEKIVDGAAPGFDQVEVIRTWVHANVRYEAGTSTSSTSAVDTERERRGVCRDMAHLSIALTRALSIPARMVVGYLYGLEPMDLHAWFEAYIGGRWFAFDPKEPSTLGGRIVVGYGRDAADVALATQFARSDLQELRVEVERLA